MVTLDMGKYGNVLRTLHSDAHKTSHFNVLRSSVEGILRTLVGDVTWRYIEDHIGTFMGRLLGVFLSTGKLLDKTKGEQVSV